MFPHGEIITIRSVVTDTDDNGDSTTVATDTPWGPCAIAPRGTGYVNQTAESVDTYSPAVVVGLTILGPPVALDSDDLLIIPEGSYYAGVWQVEGIPGDYHHPMTGWHPGVEVAAKRASAV